MNDEQIRYMGYNITRLSLNEGVAIGDIGQVILVDLRGHSPRLDTVLTADEVTALLDLLPQVAALDAYRAGKGAE